MFDVLLITGGAGTGKTSTAADWAASRQGLAAHLSHDTVLHFVKSGILSPAHSQTTEAERQWRMAIDVCVAAARIYATAGVRCAIDTFLLPDYQDLWRDLSHLQVGLVVLHPPVEVAVARNAARFQQSGWGVAEWQVRANHDAMSAWCGHAHVFMIDNSETDRGQLLNELDEWERSRDNEGRGSLWQPMPPKKVP
jgi:chloramphenicol 3-O-phosphotransferase